MDLRLAAGAALAIPVLCLLCAGLVAAIGPLGGAGVALLVYWAGLGAALRLTQDPYRLRELLVAIPPGRLVSLTLALPVVAMGAVAMRLLGDTALPPHLIIAAALAAIVHATLEELFWRGALLPRPDPGPAALALGLYWLFHLAWLGLLGIASGAPFPLLLLAPLALGGVWTAARLTSGTLGASILGHAGFALFLFVAALVQGWTPL